MSNTRFNINLFVMLDGNSISYQLREFESLDMDKITRYIQWMLFPNDFMKLPKS